MVPGSSCSYLAAGIQAVGKYGIRNAIFLSPYSVVNYTTPQVGKVLYKEVYFGSLFSGARSRGR